ncbi:6094_t:CDS:2, partial [Racocetra fulgida]
TYVDIDSRVRPLAMMIKHWARQRVLNDAAHNINLIAKGGTLSTYTWTCMILNFLQMRDPPILPVLHKIPHEPNIVHGVDVSFYEDIEKLEGFGNSNKNNESVGEEPFNTSRNLGNSADDVSVNGLKEEFRRAVKILYEKEGKENGRIVSDNNDFREKDESSKNDDESSYQRPINSKYYPNSKNGNIFVPPHNYDHYNQNFITDSKQDSVSDVNWRSNYKIYPSEAIQISNSSENRRQSSELSESSINTQKSGDDSNRIPTYASAHKPTMPLNNKLICASSQKHIGQPNQKSFNIQSKSMVGTNRNSDHESGKKFSHVPDHKPVREMKSNFNHLSNVNSVHDPDKQSSPNLGCQTTQASNIRPGQTYNKSANLHTKPSCHSSRPNEESNYKSYAYGGCGENNTLFKNYQNLTPPKINGGHVQLTMQMFDKKPIHPVAATYIPPNNIPIYSSQHAQNHNSQSHENFPFPRRLSHQSSSDGSNSHTSVNSSNTSYSSNGYQQNVNSNKPRDNYYSNNHQHNGSNFGKKKRHYNNNSGNVDNCNGQNFQGRNLSNEPNSVPTSVNSVRSQSVTSTHNERSNDSMSYNSNGFKTYNGVNNN